MSNEYAHNSLPSDWLFDAPLFIDDLQIKSLYYALALPEYSEESVTIATKELCVSKWNTDGQLEVSTGTGALLAELLASINAKVTAKAGFGREKTRGSEKTIKLNPVDSAERRLLNLSAHYAAKFSDHVWNVRGLQHVEWLGSATYSASGPKPLVFLDVDPDTPIVPMAAELSEGKVVLFFDKIKEALQSSDVGPVPDYPRDGNAQKMDEYWSWFDKAKPYGFHSSYKLKGVVEDVIGANGRPRWIDCRVPLGPPGQQHESLHLNIRGRQNYDTGDFAYRLVHRARKHGFRVVGTLKSGPALNVLALYEK